MKIIGSVTSPFTRIVRVLCEELALSYEFELTAPFGKLDRNKDEFVATFNPLMKVPALQDGDQLIFDSRVISAYLLKRNPTAAIQLPELDAINYENLLTVIYGVVDAGILSFMLKISYPGIDTTAGYISRCTARIDSGLAWLSAQPGLGEGFGLAEIALICGLDWFAKRNIVPWRRFGSLAQTYDEFSSRQSFLRTAIPDAI
jgi:glutathione S-transferase